MPATDKQVCPKSLTSEQLQAALAALDAEDVGSDNEAGRTRRYGYRRTDLVVHMFNKWGELESSFQVATRNICANGLGFLHQHMLIPGQVVKLEIPLIDGAVVQTVARVVRCRCLKDRVHEVGVEFTELKDGTV